MQLTELERPISDIVPHIFSRSVLSVRQADSLLQVGGFLAIGPDIYVDGLVVLDGQKPVGRIVWLIHHTIHPGACKMGASDSNRVPHHELFLTIRGCK